MNCKKCKGFGHIYIFVSDEHITEDQYLGLPEDERQYCDKKECDRCEGSGEEPEDYVPEYGGLSYYPLIAFR